MHPLFRSRNALLAYGAACLPVAVLYRLVLAFSAKLSFAESAAVSVTLTTVLAAVCLIPWYVCRLLPLHTGKICRATVGHLVTAIWASAIVTGVLSGVVIGATRIFPGLKQRFTPAIPAVAVLILLTYCLSVALHYLVLAVENSRQAEVLSREAQLKALKAQINPHFLFNSLNSISALTAVDPSRAREMCIRLSEFLRNSLRLGERGSVPLFEELALTRTYLDVERVRFGDRLRVKQEFDRECDHCEVPSLLVQPLVENAIKHGIATLVEGGEIIMSGTRSQHGLQFIVENPFDPEAPVPEKNGFGLINVRNRLQARYGGAATLDIHVERDRYRVMVTLPWEGVKGARA
ncbi:MAG: signal transduction histidine kinase, LytS [Bryobacterales bacterium]|jgi:two-component system, LytTR family, sensor histidine kinase AlgZ|nr:signal transduction histidine kinase, LytS [Bryobacterales bacterium]